MGSGASGWGRGHWACIAAGWQGQPATAGQSMASPCRPWDPSVALTSARVSHVCATGPYSCHPPGWAPAGAGLQADGSLIIWLMKPPQPQVGCAAPSPALLSATLAVPTLEPQTPAVGSPGKCGSGPTSPAVHHGGEDAPKPPRSTASLPHTSPQWFPVQHRWAVGHSPLSQLAHPGWQGLHLRDPVWGPHFPLSCQVSIAQCGPGCVFVAQFGLPGAAGWLQSPRDVARAAAAPGVVQGWGCSRSPCAGLPRGGARDPQGLKHPPPPLQERRIPLCQSCSGCQWHSHGPEQLHRAGTPFIPLNRARTSLRGGKWVWGEGTPLHHPLLLVACLPCQDRVSAPCQGVVARPCVPARAPGWQGGGQRQQLPWGTTCDRSSPCILLHHPPARQVGQVAELSPPKIPPPAKVR